MAKTSIPIPTDRLQAFAQRWGVAEIAVFGSVLREDFGPDSDIDVLVTLGADADLSLFDWVDMIAELEGLFGRKVDLVSRQGLRNPFRRRQILSTREVVYRAA